MVMSDKKYKLKQLATFNYLSVYTLCFKDRPQRVPEPRIYAEAVGPRQKRSVTMH